MTPGQAAELEGLQRNYIEARRRAAEGVVGASHLVDDALTPLRRYQYVLADREHVAVYMLARCGVEDGGHRVEAHPGDQLEVTGTAAAKLISMGFAELDCDAPPWWPIGTPYSGRFQNIPRSDYVRKPQAVA